MLVPDGLHKSIVLVKKELKYSSATLAFGSRYFLHTAYLAAHNRTSHTERRLCAAILFIPRRVLQVGWTLRRTVTFHPIVSGIGSAKYKQLKQPHIRSQ